MAQSKLATVDDWIAALIREQIKCVVFDFDCTLIKFHTRQQIPDETHSLLRTTLDQHPKKIPLNFAIDSSAFCLGGRSTRNMFDKLDKNGIKYAIASFGYQVIITGYLNTIFRDAPIPDIITPSRFAIADKIIYPTDKAPEDADRCPDFTNILGNKNIMLKFVQTKHSLSKDEILLYDDDYKNIKAAEDAGYLAKWVPDGFMF